MMSASRRAARSVRWRRIAFAKPKRHDQEDGLRKPENLSSYPPPAVVRRWWQRPVEWHRLCLAFRQGPKKPRLDPSARVRQDPENTCPCPGAHRTSDQELRIRRQGKQVELL